MTRNITIAISPISHAKRISPSAEDQILASIDRSEVRYIGAGTIPVVIF